MIPGARVSAAIEILNEITAGTPAEQALTRWARRSRFAGSKDRAAIRDHVFDVLRRQRSAAHFGQGEDGRALMIGMLHQQGADLASLFNGEGHAPAPLSDAERTFPAAPSDRGISWNLPDWIIPHFEDSLGDQAGATAHALQARAPVFLRVNLAKGTRADARRLLTTEGVETRDTKRAPAALEITSGARAVRNSKAFKEGYVELQDASSQAVVASISGEGRLLDYCAGGGGKALALAMTPGREVFAHDTAPERMADIPARAARAGVTIPTLRSEELMHAAPFDVVLCDAPCSGSGSWRRAPDGKWRLTAERLAELTETQDNILDAAAALVRPGGRLVYATCSVLKVENEDRVAAFLLRHTGWAVSLSERFAVDAEGDGFFAAHLLTA